jgi:hypothetical protein
MIRMTGPSHRFIEKGNVKARVVRPKRRIADER